MNGPINDFYGENHSVHSPRIRPYNAQSLNRQASRQFDGFAGLQDNMYEDMPNSFDAPRYGNRVSSGIPGGFGGYDVGMPQAWNSSGYSQNQQLAALGATTRAKPPGRSGRGALPSMWLDQQQHTMPHQNNFAPFGGSPMGFSPMRSDQLHADGDDELIPTAIVIKNIPFAVKKEQLTDVMTNMGLPLPYAFNYHFDHGVFRGLAFANFTTPDETAQVIQAMNHYELHGRKLRVEYKKMLPQAERDRIEREKRERRGQLEEQHRPVPGSSLHNQQSMSSMSSQVHAASPSPQAMSPEGIDFNDPTTLNYYSRLLVFHADASQGDVLAFPADLPSSHRTVIHGLAHQLKLGHESHGSGTDRKVHVYRTAASASAAGIPSLDPSRRQLNRAATTDFTNVRSNEASLYGGQATQSSGFLGAFADSHGLSAGSNLRAAKSFADLRSYTPSPAQSASSFPAALTTNLSRFQDYAPGSPNSSRSNITPTTMAGGHETILNGMGNMSLGSAGFGQPSGSPHRLRGIASWDRESSGPGPIGGHRQHSGTQDDQGRSRVQGGSLRQPRPVLAERSGGLARGRAGHQQRGSDELSSPSNPSNVGVEIVVE